MFFGNKNANGAYSFASNNARFVDGIDKEEARKENVSFDASGLKNRFTRKNKAFQQSDGMSNFVNADATAKAYKEGKYFENVAGSIGSNFLFKLAGTMGLQNELVQGLTPVIIDTIQKSTNPLVKQSLGTIFGGLIQAHEADRIATRKRLYNDVINIFKPLGKAGTLAFDGIKVTADFIKQKSIEASHLVTNSVDDFMSNLLSNTGFLAPVMKLLYPMIKSTVVSVGKTAFNLGTSAFKKAGSFLFGGIVSKLFKTSKVAEDASKQRLSMISLLTDATKFIDIAKSQFGIQNSKLDAINATLKGFTGQPGGYTASDVGNAAKGVFGFGGSKKNNKSKSDSAFEQGLDKDDVNRTFNSMDSKPKSGIFSTLGSIAGIAGGLFGANYVKNKYQESKGSKESKQSDNQNTMYVNSSGEASSVLDSQNSENTSLFTRISDKLSDIFRVSKENKDLNEQQVHKSDEILQESKEANKTNYSEQILERRRKEAYEKEMLKATKASKTVVKESKDKSLLGGLLDFAKEGFSSLVGGIGSLLKPLLLAGIGALVYKAYEEEIDKFVGDLLGYVWKSSKEWITNKIFGETKEDGTKSPGLVDKVVDGTPDWLKWAGGAAGVGGAAYVSKKSYKLGEKAGKTFNWFKEGVKSDLKAAKGQKIPLGKILKDGTWEGAKSVAKVGGWSLAKAGEIIIKNPKKAILGLILAGGSYAFGSDGKLKEPLELAINDEGQIVDQYGKVVPKEILEQTPEIMETVKGLVDYTDIETSAGPSKNTNLDSEDYEAIKAFMDTETDNSPKVVSTDDNINITETVAKFEEDIEEHQAVPDNVLQTLHSGGYVSDEALVFAGDLAIGAGSGYLTGKGIKASIDGYHSLNSPNKPLELKTVLNGGLTAEELDKSVKNTTKATSNTKAIANSSPNKLGIMDKIKKDVKNLGKTITNVFTTETDKTVKYATNVVNTTPILKKSVDAVKNTSNVVSNKVTHYAGKVMNTTVGKWAALAFKILGKIGKFLVKVVIPAASAIDLAYSTYDVLVNYESIMKSVGLDPKDYKSRETLVKVGLIIGKFIWDDQLGGEIVKLLDIIFKVEKGEDPDKPKSNATKDKIDEFNASNPVLTNDSSPEHKSLVSQLMDTLNSESSSNPSSDTNNKEAAKITEEEKENLLDIMKKSMGGEYDNKQKTSRTVPTVSYEEYRSIVSGGYAAPKYGGDGRSNFFTANELIRNHDESSLGHLHAQSKESLFDNNPNYVVADSGIRFNSPMDGSVFDTLKQMQANVNNYDNSNLNKVYNSGGNRTNTYNYNSSGSQITDYISLDRFENASNEEKMKIGMDLIGITESAGDVGNIAILKDGAGISFGHKQVTEGSGNLEKFLKEYHKLSGDKRALKFANNFKSGVVHNEGFKPQRGYAGDRNDLLSYLKEIGRTSNSVEAQTKVVNKTNFASAERTFKTHNITDPKSKIMLYDAYNNGFSTKLLPKNPSYNDILVARAKWFKSIQHRHTPSTWSSWANKLKTLHMGLTGGAPEEIDRILQAAGFKYNVEESTRNARSRINKYNKTASKNAKANTPTPTPTKISTNKPEDNIQAYADNPWMPKANKEGIDVTASLETASGGFDNLPGDNVFASLDSDFANPVGEFLADALIKPKSNNKTNALIVESKEDVLIKDGFIPVDDVNSLNNKSYKLKYGMDILTMTESKDNWNSNNVLKDTVNISYDKHQIADLAYDRKVKNNNLVAQLDNIENDSNDFENNVSLNTPNRSDKDSMLAEEIYNSTNYAMTKEKFDSDTTHKQQREQTNALKSLANNNTYAANTITNTPIFVNNNIMQSSSSVSSSNTVAGGGSTGYSSAGSDISSR